MHTLALPLPYDPNRLLDTLTTWLDASTDKALARILRLSPLVIRGMRTGHLPVRASILTLMSEAAGKSIDELRPVLGDRRKKARMMCSARAA